jgi:periplasmic divalent cation tolerance protein
MKPTADAFVVVLCTCPDEHTAQRIASALVNERLAACVNVLPGIRSIFRWEGRVESSTEALLVIKSRGDAYPDLEARILELHPYELPEVVAVAITGGAVRYLDWIAEAVENRT